MSYGIRLASYAGRVPTDTEAIRQRAAASRRWVEAGAPLSNGRPFLDLATRELFDHDIPALIAEVERLTAILAGQPRCGDTIEAVLGQRFVCDLEYDHPGDWHSQVINGSPNERTSWTKGPTDGRAIRALVAAEIRRYADQPGLGMDPFYSGLLQAADIAETGWPGGDHA